LGQYGRRDFSSRKGVCKFLNHVILIFCQRYVDWEQKASFFSGKWSEKNIFTVLCFFSVANGLVCCFVLHFKIQNSLFNPARAGFNILNFEYRTLNVEPASLRSMPLFTLQARQAGIEVFDQFPTYLHGIDRQAPNFQIRFVGHSFQNS